MTVILSGHEHRKGWSRTELEPGGAERGDVTTGEALERVRQGDVDCYRVIVETYVDSVRQVIAYALTSQQHADELLHEVFVQAYLKLHTYDARYDLGTWLRAIARNKVRAHWRHAAREEKHLSTYRDHIEDQWRQARKADRHQAHLHEALARCRDKLEGDGAKALSLRYEEGLSLEQVGETLQRTAEATRQLLYRLRTGLRDCIEKTLARAQ